MMNRFPHPIMMVSERPQQHISNSGGFSSPNNSDNLVIDPAGSVKSRSMEELFFLDFSANIPSMNSGSNHETPISPCCKEPTLNRDPSPYSSILVVGKKVPNSGCSITKRRKFSQEDQGTTVQQLKVSAMPLLLPGPQTPSTKRNDAMKKSSSDIHPDCEDGSSLADFLNLLSPDPGFESACGGDCSPPPVDLSALDGLALDFPLNGCCNTDNGYGSSSSLGGGSPPSSTSTVSAVQPGLEQEYCDIYSDARKINLKRKLNYSQCNDGTNHGLSTSESCQAKGSTPTPTKRNLEAPVSPKDQFQMLPHDATDQTGFNTFHTHEGGFHQAIDESKSKIYNPRSFPDQLVSSSTDSNFGHVAKPVDYGCSQNQVTDLVLVSNSSKMDPKANVPKAPTTEKGVPNSSGFQVQVKMENNNNGGGFGPGNLADKLLQQCLVPVLPNAREMNMGAWFRCRLCHRVEPTTRLLAHASHFHRINEIATATSECISSCYQDQMASNAVSNGTWCEGAFPPDLEDVAIAASSGHSFEPSTVRSPNPNELLPLDPPVSFDADFDVVDDMKFIDSLIQTMPTEESRRGLPQTEDFVHFPVVHNSHNFMGCNEQQQPQPTPPSQPQQHPPTQPPTSSPPNIYLDTSEVNNYMPASHRQPSQGTLKTGSHFPAQQQNCNASSKKSSPQFRWRRRKRRSKAQYPEMSRYLLPIDDGEEVQHLGRTLECTLCGLRGKRCHLTLHFKAKHNEVIDLTKAGKISNINPPSSKQQDNRKNCPSKNQFYRTPTSCGVAGNISGTQGKMNSFQNSQGSKHSEQPIVVMARSSLTNNVYHNQYFTPPPLPHHQSNKSSGVNHFSNPINRNHSPSPQHQQMRPEVQIKEEIKTSPQSSPDSYHTMTSPNHLSVETSISYSSSGTSTPTTSPSSPGSTLT